MSNDNLRLPGERHIEEKVQHQFHRHALSGSREFAKYITLMAVFSP